VFLLCPHWQPQWQHCTDAVQKECSPLCQLCQGRLCDILTLTCGLSKPSYYVQGEVKLLNRNYADLCYAP